jgi:Lrp/AsnC family transcriptional regulator, leucine-responsive regulatory protein
MTRAEVAPATGEIDAVDRLLMIELQKNARATYADLGKMLKMSPPAIAGRIRRLETRGIITGYHAKVDLNLIGLKVVVFISVDVAQSMYTRFQAWALANSSVMEIHHVAGTDSFLLKVAVEAVSNLESIIGSINQFGNTTTSLVLSSILENRILDNP